MAMHKGGPVAGAAVLRRGLESAQADLGIGSIDLRKMEVGKVGDEP